ncbi:MAG TPA: DUF4333 domain-containing protein [Actinomycetota bacterium]
MVVLALAFVAFITFMNWPAGGEKGGESLDDVGSSPVETFDTAGLEEELTRQVEEQTDDARVSVDCPADVPMESGRSFECTGELKPGASFTIRVTQVDDQGNVEWVLLESE